ncbi:MULTISPECIES: glycine-rich domain-containing protein-like [unclassified Leptolyngbya]|uniref:glycine-rich domain-containing protein n=1 Tax=unclassified Leptolyngbya TaxID=2650499 RepID=UPI0016894932|nr:MULTISPECIES: glycine-rich domain-containing protein-like [unclassified Leptolyngbya]MBD1909459.1 glycine-rich domain-containing protein-like [Leptolyngbya sp. FACHB-8]MBD2155644.1 glycine-rich domain-containing protein-like [Leptolyngbya sp. FACHB-16]
MRSSKLCPSETFASFMQKAKQLDLSPIAYQLMYNDYGPQWSKEETVKAIAHYLGFLYLADKYPRLTLVPSYEIDQVWHYHILDTSKYMDDCMMLFGYIVHHFPYLGLRDEQDQAHQHKAYALTQALLRKHFQGISIESDTTPSDCEPIMELSHSISCQSVEEERLPVPSKREIRPRVALSMEAIFDKLQSA